MWEKLGDPAPTLRDSFVCHLHAFSGGIPRFVLFALEAVMACGFRLDSIVAIRTAFERGSPVVDTVRAQTAFVARAVKPIQDLLDSGNEKGMKDLMLGLLCVASQVSLPVVESAFEFAARFDALGLYVEGDQDSVHVVMPGLMRLALQAGRSSSMLLEGAVKALTMSGSGASAGVIGDQMEGHTTSFFTTHLHLTWFFQERLATGTPQLRLLMAELGLADRRFNFSEPFVGAFDDRLRKVTVAKPGTSQHYLTVVPNVFTLDTLKGKCVILKPAAQSASADLFVSLPFEDGGHALLMVSSKATTSRALPDTEQLKERAKAANVISALPADVRKLYGDDVFLVCFEYPMSRTVVCSCLTVRSHTSTRAGAELEFKEVLLNHNLMRELITPGIFMPDAIREAIEVRGALCCYVVLSGLAAMHWH